MALNTIGNNIGQFAGGAFPGLAGSVGSGQDGDFLTQLLRQLQAANDDKSGLSDLLAALGAQSGAGTARAGGCSGSSGSSCGGGGGAGKGSNGGCCGSGAAQAAGGCCGGPKNLAGNLQFQ